MGRVRTILLLTGLLLFSWPMMMLLHELGHIITAWVTGGVVNRLVWHPLVFSRTEVLPNPHPLTVVWGGPIVGCLLPMLLEWAAAFLRLKLQYLFQLFAGFCLITNGAYIGLGSIEGIADAGDMLRYGTPIWVLLFFGIVTSCYGLWLWHLASFRFHNVEDRVAGLPWPHVGLAWGLGILLNIVAFMIGDPGA